MLPKRIGPGGPPAGFYYSVYKASFSPENGFPGQLPVCFNPVKALNTVLFSVVGSLPPYTIGQPGVSARIDIC